MAFLNMDTTGTNETYRESNLVFNIVKYGQIVNFETTVFADSVEVYLVSSGVSNIKLKLNEDYTIPDEAIASCDNDLSAATMRDPEFDKQLISGIQIIRPFTEGTNNYLISVNYQRLYPSAISQIYHNNKVPLNLTPELILDLVTKVANHDNLLNRVTDVTTIDAEGSLVLEVDTTGTNPNNKITGERHLVNVATQRYIIHPYGGSFYGNSLKIIHPNTETVLVRGQDYELVGMDAAATKATSSTDTVWNFIAIISPLYDEVVIEYQAFGGAPTNDNYRNLADNVKSIVTYLNTAQNVTADSLGATAVMTSVFDRINTLEAAMRRLLGTPTYGDLTNGKTVVMSLASEQTGLHWYTIAQLYKIETEAGPSPTSVADTFIFRLQSSQTHFQFMCAVSVDLQNRDGDVFNVNVLSENYPRGYTSFKDYSSVESIVRPQLRVVWNESETLPGAYLQLGFDLKSVNKEIIAIEDCSGQESAWKLVDEIDQVTTPMDSDFVLPDGSSSWSDLSEISKSESMLIPFHKGHLLWCGNIDMNRTLGGWHSTILCDDLLMTEEVDITRFRKLRLNIQEESGNTFALDIPFSSGENLKGHGTFTHQEQPAYVNVEIYHDTNNENKLTVDVNYQVVSGLGSTPISIKDMVIFLN